MQLHYDFTSSNSIIISVTRPVTTVEAYHLLQRHAWHFEPTILWHSFFNIPARPHLAEQAPRRIKEETNDEAIFVASRTLVVENIRTAVLLDAALPQQAQNSEVVVDAEAS